MMRDIVIFAHRIDALADDLAVPTDQSRIRVFAKIHRSDRQRDAAFHHGAIEIHGGLRAGHHPSTRSISLSAAVRPSRA
jgi:hypothetical protein